jgi:uroporphyrinogen-III synthase
VLEHLLEQDLEGKRIVVQLHGEPLPDVVDALTAAGADVVEVPVYRWAPHEDSAAQRRLVEQIVAGCVDAVTFTSAPAVTVMLSVATELGALDGFLDALRRNVLAVCVGSITAGPLTRLGVPTVQPDRARLGALVRAVSSALPAGSPRLSIGGHAVELRGHAILVDEDVVALPPASLAVLRALAAQPGRVYSRAELLAALPAIEAGEHAVEMAVTRLRAAVGGARLVETVIKRGYRLPVDTEQSTGRSA